MPITTNCPGCKSLFRLPDALAGKQVRCQKCAQMFVVPSVALNTVEPIVAAPELPAPASADMPAPETIAAEPREEVVKSALVEASPELPKDDGPTMEAPPRVEVKPPPLPPPPLPPERQTSVLLALALLLFFLLGMVGTGTFAAIWVSTHLSPPVRVTFAPPLNAGGGVNKDVRFDGGPKKDVNVGQRPAAQPEQIFFGPDGKSFINNNTNQAPFVDHGKWDQDGPYRLYRILLKEGTVYNFHVAGFGFLPRLRVLDGDAVVADRFGVLPANRLMFAYQAKRTGDHLLWVTTRERFVGGFVLNLAAEKRKPPVQIDRTATPNFVDRASLGVEDSLDPVQDQFGPYREYEVNLEANTEYTFKVANTPYTPVLQIHEIQRVVNAPVNNFPSRIEYHYRAPYTGKFRVRVSSVQYGFGPYTFNVARKGEGFFERRLELILGRLDENNIFDDKRILTTSDPNEPKLVGRGVYKEYWIPLEQGKKYRIEMASKAYLSTLTLLDPDGNQIDRAAEMQNALLIHEANRTGTYRIRAAAHLPKDRGEYTLRITLEP